MKLFGGLLLTAAALVALTGCSASDPEPKATVEAAVLPTASATPSATPKAMALKSNVAEHEPASAPAKEQEYIDNARLRMYTYGLFEKDLSDATLLSEGEKICDSGDSYKGYPSIMEKVGASDMLVFTAESYLC